MDGFKNIFQSKTFWGALVAILASVLGLLGYSFGPEEQATVIELFTTIAGAVGGLLAIYGRVVATKAIK